MSKVKVSNFKITKTEIPGLLIIDLSLIGDDRGWFQEKFQQAKLVEAGFPEWFEAKQNNISYNKESGVVRGIHAEPWNKYISVIKGKIFCTFVDLRPGDTFGKVLEIEVTPERAIFLPKGCGNSFMTLEETYYSYLVDDFWTPELYNKYTFVNLADPELNIHWPIDLEKCTMSDRDKNHPMLKDVKPMEV
jgi:dTDP-4-dehydrorhamnose 3,5-epimerase